MAEPLGAQFEIASNRPLPHVHPVQGQPATDPGLLALDEIFRWIKFQTAQLLEAINHTIVDVNAANAGQQLDDATLAYDNAVKAFKKFINSLNDEEQTGFAGSFGPTINAANITPIRDGDGFYTSVKIVVQWQGGTHSDSTVTHVP